LAGVDVVVLEVDVDGAWVVELAVVAVVAVVAELAVLVAGWAAVVPAEAPTTAGDEDVL
jgi:hypothetical protein